MSFRIISLGPVRTALMVIVSTGLVFGQPAPAAPAKAADAAPATAAAETGDKVEKPEKSETPDKPEKAKKSEKPDKAAEAARKKRVIKLADDKENSLMPEKDPATYELSNKRLIDDYTELDRRPWDRGEHILISSLMGAIGGGIVGGMVGLSGFDQNSETKTLNSLYAFGGAGAGVGVLAGITTTFFERGKVEQFAIGKFLLKYSWYGAIGGALIGGGIGLVPYASSGDYGDIARYAGYGAGVGLAAGLTFFFIDLPDHLKLYSYRRDDQSVIMLAWRF